MKHLTVADFIEILKNMPQDLVVITDNCEVITEVYTQRLEGNIFETEPPVFRCSPRRERTDKRVETVRFIFNDPDKDRGINPPFNVTPGT